MVLWVPRRPFSTSQGQGQVMPGEQGTELWTQKMRCGPSTQKSDTDRQTPDDVTCKWTLNTRINNNNNSKPETDSSIQRTNSRLLMGAGVGRLGEKGEGIETYTLVSPNNHGDGNYSTGYTVKKKSRY